MDGRDLKLKRVALGLDQKQLARLLGVYQATISRWETGKVKISHPGILCWALRALELEAQALDVAPAELLKDGRGGSD